MSIHHVMMFNKWYVNVVNYKNLNFYLFMYVQPLGTPLYNKSLSIKDSFISPINE